MIGRIVLFFLLVPAHVVVVAESPAAPFGDCAGQGTVEARAECVATVLGPDPLESRDLLALEALAATLPEAVLVVARERAQQLSEPSPADRLVVARLHDLRGRALTELKRHDEAADAFSEALALDDGTLRLTWWGQDGEPRWSRSLDTGNGRLERAAESLLAAGRESEAAELDSRAHSLGAGVVATSTLEGDVWFKNVPDLVVPLATGGSDSLRSEREGKVLILSFWASWCAPCGRELPRLQQLLDSSGEEGLEVLAVNVGETIEVIVEYAAALELSLPVAFSTAPLEEYFKTTNLPVVAVIDGRGRVRGRWAGYEPAFAEQISDLAREIIAESSPPATVLGDVLLGGDALEVAWIREVSANVEALAVAPRAAASPGVLAAAGRALVQYGEEGDTVRTRIGPVSVSRLIRTTVDDEGRYELLGFRPGASSLVVFPSGKDAPSKWSLDSPLFDAALEPGISVKGHGPAVMIATMKGLLGATEPGASARPLPVAPGGASGVRAVSVEGEARWAVLGLDGALFRSDDQGQATGSLPVPPDGWVLVGGAPSGAGFGVAPFGLRASAVGRFLSTESEQIALATASGQLIILDAATGEPLYRVRWPGISGLAAGDLVGDSRDDLAVAEGRTVVVLTAVAHVGQE